VPRALSANMPKTVDHGTSVPEVIQCTMFVMETRRNVCLNKDDFDRLHAHLHKVAAAFMKQSFEYAIA
jgi:hypothetical protein